MLKLESTINKIVEAMLPLHIEKEKTPEYNGLVITIEMSFMEHFSDNYDKPISGEKIDELTSQYPFLKVTEHNVESKLIFSLLFLRRDTYQCFSNIGEIFPLTDAQNIYWKYETSHDTCWRENAYSTINNKLREVQMSLFNIFSKVKGSGITMPKNVVPNSTNILNIAKINTANGIACDYSYYVTLSIYKEADKIVKSKYSITKVSRKEMLENDFDKVYDLAIKDYKELTLGTRIYGTYIEHAVISSEVFRDEIGLWVQVTDNDKADRKYMLSLSTYGINYTGTHNLVFTELESYLKYRNTEQVIESHSDPIDGWLPEWVQPKKGKRKAIPENEYNAIPVKAWSCSTNDFISTGYFISKG